MPETSHEKRIKLIDLPGLTHMYKNLKKIFIRIRDIDTSLDTNSSNPIANNVVTQKFNTIQSQFSNAVDQLSDAVIASGGTISKSGEVATPAQIAVGIQTVQENAIGGAMVGDAVAANVLYGKTFTNAETSGLTGAMPDNSSTADCGGSGTAPGISSQYPNLPTRQGSNLQMTTTTGNNSVINIGVPMGYWPGIGNAYVNRPAADFGNAAQENVLNTVTFTSTAGVKKSGSMTNLNTSSPITYTSSNATKVIIGDACMLSTNSDNVARLQIRYNSTSGYLPANTLIGIPQATAASAIGLTAAKIYKGNTVLGIAGTATTPESGKTGAAAGQILTGYQAFVNGNTINGSMPNQGAKTTSLNCGESYTILAGYHNGSGKVTANSLASQTGVDSGKTAAGDGQILTGYQAWVNGVKRTGSMPNKGTWTSINGSIDSEITIPEGYHSGLGYVKVTSLGNAYTNLPIGTYKTITTGWGITYGGTCPVSIFQYNNNWYYAGGSPFAQATIEKAISTNNMRTWPDGSRVAGDAYSYICGNVLNDIFWTRQSGSGTLYGNTAWLDGGESQGYVNAPISAQFTGLENFNSKLWTLAVTGSNTGIYNFNGSAFTKAAALPVSPTISSQNVVSPMAVGSQCIYTIGFTETGFWSFNGTTWTTLTNLPITSLSSNSRGTNLCINKDTCYLSGDKKLYKFTGSAWTLVKNFSNVLTSSSDWGKIFSQDNFIHYQDDKNHIILNDLYAKSF